eukprot:GDKK01007016.1.p1 GENE.GDKK01007016.1~~GDKK01007016.1.p1  ORF type:complete len:218 (+),score=25.28 GDKK01007016.1:1-654(+)
MGEIVEGKDVRKLRHKKLIPEEEDYQDLLVSDKKLGYTGGAFPYRAKLGGGSSTMPEDEDVIARAKAAEKAERRAARKEANNGISPAETPSTSPAIGPAVASTLISPIAPLPPNTPQVPGSSSGSEEDEEEETHSQSGDIAEGDGLADGDVNPNHSKWSSHNGGVHKGYVSKRERRDLAMEARVKKRSEVAPRQSPSLIPQMTALDRVGGDADLDAI